MGVDHRRLDVAVADQIGILVIQEFLELADPRRIGREGLSGILEGFDAPFQLKRHVVPGARIRLRGLSFDFFGRFPFADDTAIHLDGSSGLFLSKRILVVLAELS